MEQIIVRPLQWSALPDINQVSALSDEDSACLEELRSVLAKHNALDRFGVSLLHSHFPVDEDECMVETIDTDARTLTVRPVKANLIKNAVQTQWKLDKSKPLQICSQWCERTSNGDHQNRHTWNADRTT